MTPPELPPPSGSPYRIGLVCLGNICRSPMAEVVLTDKVDRAGLTSEVEVSSSGTGDWHVGEPMDPRAAATLLAGGYDPSRHHAKEFHTGWLARDLILVMDAANLEEVRVQARGKEAPSVRMFRDFDPVGEGDVPDPYYGGPHGFAQVLQMAERTAIALVVALERLLEGGVRPGAPPPNRPST